MGLLLYEPPNGQIFMHPHFGKERNDFVGLAESWTNPSNSSFLQDPTRKCWTDIYPSFRSPATVI